MNGTEPTPSDLRLLSPEELERLGERSLRDHLVAQAVVAHAKHGPLTEASIPAYVADRSCIRHPLRLVFEIGNMASHQFAEPDIDWRSSDEHARVLYLRPVFKRFPELVPLALSYMIPLVNYGRIVSDDLCILYGATVSGCLVEEYYEAICRMADRVGACSREREEAPTGSACSGGQRVAAPPIHP